MPTTAGKIKIEVSFSPKITDIFIALNIFGYDEENNPKGMSMIRKKLQKEVGQEIFDKKYPTLKKITQSYHPWHLIDFALSGNNEKRYRNFFREVKKFKNEPVVRKYRKLVAEEQLRKDDALAYRFSKEIIEIFDLFKNQKLTFKKIILIINPLDSYWRGYSFKVKDSAYLITGPGNIGECIDVLSHELFHAFARNYHLPKSFQAHISKEMSKQGYISKENIRIEYIVRALNLIYLSSVNDDKYTSALLADTKKDFPNIEEAIFFIRNKVGRYNVR